MFSTKQRIAVRASASSRKQVVATSFQSPLMGAGGMHTGSNVQVAAPNMTQQKDGMLEGIVASSNDANLRPYYRDMYDFDAVAGATVDLLSTLPFSDWTLTGIEDKEQLDIFNSAMERLNIRSLLPELSIDYLVLGMFTGSLIYKSERRQFTDLIVHQPENLEITSNPIYGGDPDITLNVPSDLKAVVSGSGEFYKDLKDRLNESMLQSLKSSSKVTLDPLTTLYLPRKTYSRSIGTSFFRRILPIYLLERMLFRGTLTEATRRQKAILHIQAGDEFWEPTEKELENIVSLFQQADLDPIGAMVATRNDIQTQEIRQGGDLWKVTDMMDYTTQIKLRAMGISEAFLSGEANYHTAEAALSVFIESLRSYRYSVEKRLFHNKLFPLIAVINDFRKEGSKGNPYKVTGASKMLRTNISYDAQDASSLIVPEIKWHKQLRPEADREHLDVLQTMTDKGVPVTLRMWASAGGISMDTLMDEIEENEKLKKRIKEVTGKEVDDDEDSGGGFSFGATNAMNRKPRPILARDYGDAAELVQRTKTGKAKPVRNQKEAHERMNRAIVKATARLSESGE